MLVALSMITEAIDTHLHLWNPAMLRYPWLADAPVLNKPFLLEDYLQAIAGTPIRKSIFVECDVEPSLQIEEVKWVGENANLPNSPIIGMVAGCRPEDTGFEAHLEKLSAYPIVKGLRRVIHVAPEGTLSSPHFAGNIAKLQKYQYTFDICALPHQFPDIHTLVRKCPDVTFILDHCGVPDIKAGVFEPWKAHLKKLAGCPNLYCKISGLVAYANPETWTISDLKPYFEFTVECFGHDRILWGGDWPVCTLSASLRQWWEAALSLTAGWSESDTGKLFRETALRVYRLSA